MSDDSKIRPSDFIEDDGTLQGVIRQIEGILTAFEELNNAVKKEDFTKWLNKLTKGSNEEKVAIQALTATAERLLALEQKLIEVRAEESKELARLNQMVKDENRDKAKEAEINSKVAGSYARMKLELQQLVEQYKNTTDASQKSKLADGIILLSNELMLADKELKNLMNDYTKLSATEQARLATLERERAESEAAAESIKKRAKAEAELNEVTKNRGALESTALAEQMRKAIEERIQLEAKELMLQDQFYAKELSSAETIKQRLAIKEQLTQTEAKLKALEMQEANDLAIVKARVTMKQQQLDVEAKIVAAESQEGRNLAENEAKLKRIQQQNERNAQIATAVAGSYEHMKLTLQAKLDVLNNVNRSQGVAFSNALAEVAAAQQQVTEAEAWLNIVKQQANEQVKLNLLSDQEYQSMVQKNKELALEIKYTQGVVDSRAKLAAIQQAATTYNANGQSQLEEIKYNEQLAASYQKVEEAKAKSAFADTQAYKDQIQAENDLKIARLEAMGGVEKEKLLVEDLSKGTYAQLEARYKLLVIAIEELDNSSDDYETTLNDLKQQLNGVADALEVFDKAAGKTSNRMSSRQREWNGLTNSVYQLTRELPNLAVRADTFFLAISNNIPIFIDEFGRARKELGSFKKAFGETMRAFGKGMILAVPLLLLSKWSELRKMWDSLFNTLSDGTLKTGAFYRSLEDSVKSVSSQYAKQIQQVRTLSGLWKEADSEQRSSFLYKYKKEIDETGLSITNLNEAENAFGKNTDLVIEGYIARTKAAAAAKLATDKYTEAVKNIISAEGVATDILGTEINISGMRKRFADKYGIVDEAQIKTGKFKVDKETLRKIVDDYEQEFQKAFINNPIGAFRARTAFRVEKTGDKLKELYANLAEGELAEVPTNIAEWLAVAEDGSGKASKLAKELFNANRALAQGDQASKKAAESMDDYASSINEADVKLSDLTKKLNDFDLKVLKAVNDAKLSELNNVFYGKGRRDDSGNYNGDYSFDVPLFYSDPTGKVQEYLGSMDVKSSFDKQVVQLRQGRQETIKELNNWIDELTTLSHQVTGDQKILVESRIAELNGAITKHVNTLEDEIGQVGLEYSAALARLYADNTAMRLEAIKEGSEEELALRLKSIRANMAAEIAENATQEPRLQKSVSAIRAKYRREEEQAEREWLIKRNNWRKQQLENENAAELSLTLDYYSRRRAIQQIELENELLENAELIENGQIKQEDIISKHLKAQENLWKEHRNAVLSSQKSMWDVVEELAQTDSYKQLAAQLNKYDIELEQTKLQQQEIIGLQIPQELERIATERANLAKQLEEQNSLSDKEIELINKQIEGLDDEALKYEALSKEVADYIQLLTRLNEKRKAKAEADLNLRNLEKTQEIESIGFYSQYQVGERQGAAFELQQERELLEHRRDNAEALGYSEKEIELINAQLEDTIRKERELKGLQGTISAVANHGLAGLIKIPAKDANGQTIEDGGQPVMKDLSSDQYDALNAVFDSIKDNLNSIVQGYIDVAQASYDAAQAQVDAARTVYEAELEARANGYANDVEGAKRELALEKRKAKQKEQILKQAQKTQERINTLQQISSLITGSAQILETFGAYPVVAAILLASMWGMFAAAKIQASQLANQSSTYGSGGYEVAVGGSHASGRDIKTGIRTRRGSQMVIEGGEGVGVFSRKAVTKYGDIIPNLVDSINDGSYGSLDHIAPSAAYGSMDFGNTEPIVRTQYAKELVMSQPATKPTDLSTIEDMLRSLVNRKESNSVVLSDGSIMERKGNRTTITRRG